MIRVAVKASSPIVQTGLEKMITSEPDLRIIPETSRQPGRREVSDEEPPDVIIVEIEEADEETPWVDLLDIRGPDTALLLLADDPDALHGGEALRAGAKGILPRRTSREELVAAVRAAAAGLIVLHAESASTIFPGRPPAVGRPGSLIEPLTAREKEVLVILAEGGSNKEIASRLSISEHTAKFHVSSIISKLGATSRTEAVTLAIRQGIIMV